MLFMMMYIAHGYPDEPNPITRRYYHQYFTNLPVFISDRKMSNHFLDFLKNVPVQNYLKTREHLVEWVHMYHNHLNISRGDPKTTKEQTINAYFAKYDTTPKVSDAVKLAGLGVLALSVWAGARFL